MSQIRWSCLLLIFFLIIHILPVLGAAAIATLLHRLHPGLNEQLRMHYPSHTVVIPLPPPPLTSVPAGAWTLTAHALVGSLDLILGAVDTPEDRLGVVVEEVVVAAATWVEQAGEVLETRDLSLFEQLLIMLWSPRFHHHLHTHTLGHRLPLGLGD